MNGNTPQEPVPFPGEPERPTPPASQPGGFTPPPPRPPMPQRPPPPAGAVPPPPAPEFGVRTIASDVSSIKESGGMQPQPKTFRPEDLSGAPIFKPEPSEAVKKPDGKLWVILGGIIVLLIVGGLVFFFFLKPLIFPVTEVNPVPTGAVTPPPSETSTPLVTETSTPEAVFKHQSFFNPAPTLSETVAVTTALADLTAAIQKATSDSQPAGTVKELIMATDKVGAAKFLSVVLPDLDTKFTDANLEKDFTAFAYYDANGVWPGYVLKLKDKADLAQAKSTIAAIEKSVNLINFYLVSPGAPKSSTFKDGAPVKDNPVRYLSHTKAGASFNYAWLGNELVISTSYSGFKEAAKLLGF